MGKLVRKNVLLDPQALRRAQKILRTRSESEAIREAINLVAFRKAVIDGFLQGKEVLQGPVIALGS